MVPSFLKFSSEILQLTSLILLLLSLKCWDYRHVLPHLASFRFKCSFPKGNFVTKTDSAVLPLDKS